MKLLSKFLASKVFKKVFFAVLTVLSKQTENKIDDELVKAIKACFD